MNLEDHMSIPRQTFNFFCNKQNSNSWYTSLNKYEIVIF